MLGARRQPLAAQRPVFLRQGQEGAAHVSQGHCGPPAPFLALSTANARYVARSLGGRGSRRPAKTATIVAKLRADSEQSAADR